MSETMYKASQWKEAECDHKRHNPSEGDYWWCDHFCPVLVVLSVTGKFVTVCRETKDARDNKWTWDLSKPSIMDREAFEKKLEGARARVGGSHFWAVTEFKKPVASATLSDTSKGGE